MPETKEQMHDRMARMRAQIGKKRSTSRRKAGSAKKRYGKTKWRISRSNPNLPEGFVSNKQYFCRLWMDHPEATTTEILQLAKDHGVIKKSAKLANLSSQIVTGRVLARHESRLRKTDVPELPAETKQREHVATTMEPTTVTLAGEASKETPAVPQAATWNVSYDPGTAHHNGNGRIAELEKEVEILRQKNDCAGDLLTRIALYFKEIG